jgi:hypothetical protein
MTNQEILKWNENFELVTGYNSREISQMTPLDLLMRMRKKRSASGSVLFSKKISVEVEFYTKAKVKYTIISISYIEYGTKMSVRNGLRLNGSQEIRRGN